MLSENHGEVGNTFWKNKIQTEFWKSKKTKNYVYSSFYGNQFKRKRR